MTLKQLIKELSPEERKLLFDAFESETTAIIKLAGGRFVGVNCDGVPTCKIEEQQGYWSTGVITCTGF